MNKIRESLTKYFDEAFEVLMKRKLELMEELERIERKLAQSTDLEERVQCRLAFDKSILQMLRHLGRLVLDAKSAIKPDRETLFSSKPICIHSPLDNVSSPSLLVVTDDSQNTFSLVDSKQDKIFKSFGSNPSLSPDLSIGGVARIKDKIIVSIFNKDILHTFSKEGKFEKTVGSSGRGKDQFLGPSDLSTHGNHLLVCERDNSRIQVLQNYTHSHFIGWYDNKPGVIRKPRSVCVGPNKDVYVLHSGVTSISIYSFNGEPKASFGSHCMDVGELRDSSRLAVTAQGDILVCGGGGGSLYCFHHNLNSCFVYPSDKDTSFHKPWDVCVDSKGNILLTDPERMSLLTFSLDNSIVW